MRPLTDEEVKRHSESIQADGYAVMEDAIDENLRDAIGEELARLAKVRPGGDIPPAPFSGFHTRRWFDLLNDGDVWQEVAVHPWVLQVLAQVLGDGFLLSTLGTAVIGPGEADQPLHVDDGVYAFPRPHPNLVCNTMWALSDFTRENGATRVVPGSNHFDEDPDYKEQYETVHLEMPAGSIAFVVGSCYHGAGANRSQQDRVALTINYCNGSMRQQENLMLATHPSRMLTFSKALQDLLGFKVCKGAGHMLAQDPRAEMNRHYGPADEGDPYIERRNALHAERLVARDEAARR